MADVPSEAVPVPLTPAQRTPSGNALSMRGLKEFVMSQFPEDHPLRAVILAERDVLTPTEFLAKSEVWAVLLNRRA